MYWRSVLKSFVLGVEDIYMVLEDKTFFIHLLLYFSKASLIGVKPTWNRLLACTIRFGVIGNGWNGRMGMGKRREGHSLGLHQPFSFSRLLLLDFLGSNLWIQLISVVYINSSAAIAKKWLSGYSLNYGIILLTFIIMIDSFRKANQKNGDNMYQNSEVHVRWWRQISKDAEM